MNKGKYKNILLIFPPIRNLSKAFLMPPLGITYLAAVIKDKYKVHLLDAYVEGYRQRVPSGECFIKIGLSYEEIDKRIREISPDVVGITTLYSTQWPIVTEIMKRVKKIDPGIITVTGGTHPSFLARECMQDKNLDFIIIGEGEYSFKGLLDALNANGDLSKIDGLAYRKNNQVYINPKQKYIEDLNELPLPARELLPLEKYFVLGGVNSASIITSRGCINHCIFCSSVNFWGRRLRPRSPDKVVAEIEYLNKKHGVNKIYFEDDHLLFDINHAKEIFRGIIKKNLAISWITPNGIFPRKLDDELIYLMEKSGCVSLTFAVESGSERVRNNIIQKRINWQEAEESIKKVKKAGIATKAFFIIGFPGETKKDTLQTIKLATSNLFNVAEIFIASPLPGTQLYQEMKNSGILTHNFSFTNTDYSMENTVFHNFKKGTLFLIVKATVAYIAKKYRYQSKKNIVYQGYVNRLLKNGNFSLEGLIKAIKIERSKEMLNYILAIKYLRKELRLKLKDMILMWLDWLGEDVYLLCVSTPKSKLFRGPLKKKIKGFIGYLCKGKNTNFNFYKTLVEKQLTSVLKKEVQNAEEAKI